MEAALRPLLPSPLLPIEQSSNNSYPPHHHPQKCRVEQTDPLKEIKQKVQFLNFFSL